MLSEANRRRDLVDKLRLYGAARVPAYWVADPDADRLEVYALVDDAYALHGVHARPAVVVPDGFPEVRLDLDGLAAELAQTPADILVVAPDNTHTGLLDDRLRGVRVGTVDKFQGQEAPVVVYSMATSPPEDAPRGMEFLYSLNRLNVATARARCACILVASPKLFQPDCKTPRQMQLANAVCRYRELARVVDVEAFDVHAAAADVRRRRESVTT